MADVNDVNVVLCVPKDLYEQVKNVSLAYQSDFQTDMVRLMEMYVSSYRALTLDPAVAVLVGGK